MRIDEILQTNIDGLKAWVPFNEKIQFQLRYVGRAELRRMSQECVAMKYNPAKRVREQGIDQDLFSAKFCARVVIGWRGVTPSALSEIIPVDLTKVPADQQDTEIEFTQENLLAIFKEAYDVDQFLQDTSVNASVFRPHQEEERKNLSASQNGN